MKLFKQSKDSDLYEIHELTDDQLIAEFNICINYKGYLSQIMKLPDKSLMVFALGKSAKELRELLKKQEDFCTEYIEMWQETLNAGKPNKLKN
jgi:hypothetical protein